MATLATPKVEKDSDSGMESSISSLSSTTENEQVTNRKKARKRELFYERFPDGTFRFSDGKELKVNIVLLSAKSEVFQQLFLDSSPDHIVEIDDYDLSAFKLFLDCLMGFQELSVTDALLIFPLALKYDLEKLINKCSDILKPVELNENVCLSLNMALFHKCDKLSDAIVNFLTGQKLIFMLLDEEKYFTLLEPESMLKLLDNVRIDSYVLSNVFQWGMNYLNKIGKTVDLKSFFIQHNISDKLTLGCFETPGSFFEFDKSVIGKGYFSAEDFQNYCEKSMELKKSLWCIAKAGDVLIEKFVIRNVAFVENYITELKIFRNDAIAYKRREVFFEQNFFECNYFYTVKDIPTETVNVDKKDIRYCEINSCAIDIDLKMNLVSDLELKVERTFKMDCRILKKSPGNIVPVDSSPDDLFFVNEVELSHKKIVDQQEKVRRTVFMPKSMPVKKINNTCSALIFTPASADSNST